MKDHPIIFNGKMVQAILNGHKTQTRRVMKPQPVLGRPWKNWTVDPDEMDLPTAYCPYGIRGDRLWVRETFLKPFNDVERVLKYRADADSCYLTQFKEAGVKWTPSIFMPRWASRITLEITGVRTERVQGISMNDALREGADPKYSDYQSGSHCIGWFRRFWDSINAKRGFGWDVDPWVWVIEFKVR